MKQKRDSIGRFASMPVKPKPPTPGMRAPDPASTIRVKARRGTREIPVNEITNDTRWVYTNGQCFALAIILAEKNDTDVGLLVSGSSLPWGTKYDDPNRNLDLDHDWFKDTIHAVALTEDSVEDNCLIIDIDGKKDMLAVKEDFIYMHSGTLIRIKPEQLRFLLSKRRRGTGFYEPDYESAEIVERLL